MSQTVVKALKTGNIEDAKQYLASINTKGIFEESGLANWFTDTLGKYCNGNW
jgi:hypothetical protein